MLKIVDLFSGVGGIALGFETAGSFKTLLANDVDHDMCEAFKLNLPNIPMLSKSIADIDFRQVLSGEGVDIVVGGPPCQAYSTSGKRLLDDPRAVLYKQYYRALKEIKPQMFIYENVKGLLSMAQGRLFEELTRLFATLGYSVQARILNAADFGVPQSRERVIVVGVRDSLKFSYPSPTHSNKVENSGDLFDADLLPYVTLGEAIGDLPLIESNSSAEAYICEPQNSYQKQMRIGAPKQIMDHSASPHGESLMSVIRHVPEGGVKADIPPEFRPLSGFPNSYSRLWWNKPSTTITRNLGTPSSARCIHPLCDRGLTTREGARLQSFPDRFKFSGNRSKRNLQVGNAVPPLLALALALQVKQAFR